MNNYEKIKQMTVEEMALLLDTFVSGKCFYCPSSEYCKNGGDVQPCRKIFKQWLESEVGND